MNILIVSSYLPYPLFSGGHVRLFNIIRELAKNHTITLVCEKRPYQTEEDIEQLRRYCKQVVVFSRKKQWSLQNIIKTGFSQNPFLITGHINESMKIAIKKLVTQESFDVIHAETFYIMQNIPETTVPVVLVEHNIEYLVYKRFAQRAPFFLKPLLSIDIKKLKRVETTFWEKASVLVAVSEEEKEEMNRTDIVVVPNGVDTKAFTFIPLRNKTKEKRVLFIGDFRWMQNRDAISWILKEIWPAFLQLFPDKDIVPKLWVVSREIPDSIKNLTHDSSVIFDTNAPKETHKIFAQSYLLLAPIRVGGGTSFKILEAMASGVPVITTPLGIEGIKAANNKEVILAKNTTDFVEGMHTLFTEEKMYNTIAEKARLLIEEKYDWKRIVLSLEFAYALAIKK